MYKQQQIISKVIRYSRCVLGFSLIAFVCCLLISYPYADQFSILVQVSAHILTIVFAGCFKIAVIALMAATKEHNNHNVCSTLGDNDVTA